MLMKIRKGLSKVILKKEIVKNLTFYDQISPISNFNKFETYFQALKSCLL